MKKIKIIESEDTSSSNIQVIERSKSTKRGRKPLIFEITEEPETQPSPQLQNELGSTATAINEKGDKLGQKIEPNVSTYGHNDTESILKNRQTNCKEPQEIVTRHIEETKISEKKLPFTENNTELFTTGINDTTECTTKYEGKLENMNCSTKPEAIYHKSSENSFNNDKKLNEKKKMDSIKIKQPTISNKQFGVDYFLKNHPVIDDNFADEDTNTEYKNFKGPKYKLIDYEKIFKTLCGFLNSQGGKLYIGVDDMSHNVRGTLSNQESFEEFQSKIHKGLKESFSPIVSDEFLTIKMIPVLNSGNETIDYKLHNCFVFIISVLPDTKRVYSIKKKTIDNEDIYAAYMRCDGLTKIMTGEELNRLFLKRNINI